MTPELSRSVHEALRRQFRPELLNRIDETIVFHPLSRAQIGQIVGLLVAQVRERLAERNITCELKEAGCDWLVKEGFDVSLRRPSAAPGHPAPPGEPAFPGRPIRRVQRGRPRGRRRERRRRRTDAVGQPPRA